MAADSPAAAPAWLPDWRDASAYPAEPSDNAWRWQFLRRHPQYQGAWATPWDARYRRKVFGSSLFGGSLLSLDQARDIEAMHSGIEVHEVVKHEGICSLFGVNFLLDPALPTLPPAIEERFWRKAEPYVLRGLPAPVEPKPTLEQWKRVHEQWERANASGQCAIVFDVKFPLKPQLEFALQKLEATQLALGMEPLDQRNHRKYFAAYLRVLDARAAQPPASWDEISRHMPDVTPLTANPPKFGEQAQAHLNKFVSAGNPSRKNL